MKHTFSAGGIIINPQGKILLINEGGEFWGLPKGRLEKDETNEDAARREVEEETGLTDFTLLAELGSYERHPYNSGVEDTSELKHITLFIIASSQTPPQDNVEHNQSAWFELDEAIGLLTHPQDKQFLQDHLTKDTLPA